MPLPGLWIVLSKLQSPDQGAQGPTCPPSYFILYCTVVCLTSYCTVVCLPSSAYQVLPPPCVFLLPNTLLTPYMWLTPTSPVAQSLDVLSSRKSLSSLTALDAPAMHSCASLTEHPELFIPYFMACLSPIKSMASQRQVLSLRCSPLFTQ